MLISRSLIAIAVAGAALVTLVSPAGAAKPEASTMTAPVLLTNPKINWVAGSSGWINLSWTSAEDLEDVRVTVVPTSAGFEVEYPETRDGYTSLMVDGNLSANGIDFTSFRASTTDANSGTKWADVEIEFTIDGERHSADAGRLQLSNKKYTGDDFAILTESSVALSGDDVDPMKNWIEVGYLGLSPMNSHFAIVISADGLPIYHPQETFTSLHHDHILNGGESDVARVFLDPTAISPGAKMLEVAISYTDVAGKLKSVTHEVALTIE